jgi:hypothetical protein
VSSNLRAERKDEMVEGIDRLHETSQNGLAHMLDANFTIERNLQGRSHRDG